MRLLFQGMDSRGTHSQGWVAVPGLPQSPVGSPVSGPTGFAPIMMRFKFVDKLGGTAALGNRLGARGLEPLGRLRLSSRFAPLVLFIPSFAAPPPVRGFKFVDLLGDTEVVTPFYLVGRAEVGARHRQGP